MKAIIRGCIDGKIVELQTVDNFYDVVILCEDCNKKFKSPQALRDHIDAKHKHETFADRALQAELDIACGKQTDDTWLLP